MLLKKTLQFSDCELKMDGDAGRFAGYASVFGGVDSYGDTIIKGAFESTLRKNGKPKMFLNHDWDGLPVGKWLSIKEDDKGLFVEGELTPGLGLAADVRAAMSHGTLDGLSIGGYINKGDYDETEKGRVIRKWSSLIEISPVVFPADSAARIDAGSIKADVMDAIESIESIRDAESFLRDVGGLGKKSAAALLSRIKRVSQGDPDGDELSKLAERIQRLQSKLSI